MKFEFMPSFSARMGKQGANDCRNFYHVIELLSDHKMATQECTFVLRAPGDNFSVA